MLILFSLLNLLWALIFLYFGILDLQKTLGGAICFFYFLPIIAFLALRYKDYAKILWSINSTFIGIVLVNYLHSYFSIHFININILKLAFVIFIPLSFIFCGYFYLLLSILIPDVSEVSKNSEDTKAFKYFISYATLMMSVPVILVLPLMSCIGHNKNVINNSFEIVSGVFVFTILLLLYKSRKIPKETINYFSRPIPRLSSSVEKVKIIICIGTLIFIILSAGYELKIRQHWLIWSESIAILVVNIMILLKFGLIIFMPINVQRERPSNFYFPVLKKDIIVIIILSIFLALICALISK